MKEELINQIQIQMLPFLNNAQLKMLQSVLEHAFYGVTVTSEGSTATISENSVAAFVAARLT